MTSKRHSAWARSLSAYWKEKGVIEYCELRMPGCVGRYGLAPAHSRDRRDIKTKEQFFEVIAACEKCHFALDRKMSKADRLALVKEIISNRADVVAA